LARPLQNKRESIMEIRKDFSSASVILERLLVYCKVFSDNNREHWSHLKNNEDFGQVYDMEWEVREKVERIYSVGRDFSVYMSHKLVAFNEPAEHPTLTSYINSFEVDWSFVEVDRLKKVLSDALEAKNKIKHYPWAVERMIELFEGQLELRQHVVEALNLLKNTDIYKLENGVAMTENKDSYIHNQYIISGNNSSAINVNSPSAKAIAQSLDDIKETMSQLSDVFQKAQFADKTYQEQSLEILDSISDEIQKSQPKKLSIASMISTLSGLLSIVDKEI
jgi:hypothetical protein